MARTGPTATDIAAQEAILERKRTRRLEAQRAKEVRDRQAPPRDTTGPIHERPVVRDTTGPIHERKQTRPSPITARPQPVPRSKADLAKDVAIGLIPIVGTVRDARRLANDWDNLSARDRAIQTGLVGVSALGDALIVVGGVGLLFKAVRGGVATVKVVTTSASEAGTMLQAARATTKGARITTEVVAESSAKYLDEVGDLAKVMRSGERADIIIQPTARSIRAASKVDDALVAAGRSGRGVLEVDSTLSPTQIKALVDAAKAERYKTLIIRTVDRPFTKKAGDDIAEAIVNAKRKHGISTSKEAVIKSLKPPGATSTRNLARQLNQAGVKTTRITERITPGKVPTRLKTGAVRLEASLPSVGRGNVLVRVGGKTGITTSIRAGTGGTKAARAAATAGALLTAAGIPAREGKPIKAPVAAPMPPPSELRARDPSREPGVTRVNIPFEFTSPAPAPAPTAAGAATRQLTQTTTAAGKGVLPVPLVTIQAQLKQGQFIRSVQWAQGKTLITKDLLTGSTRHQANPGDPKKKPWDTLKVVETSTTRPKRQRIDLGIVDVIVNGRSIRFTRSTGSRGFNERRIRTRGIKDRKL